MLGLTSCENEEGSPTAEIIAEDVEMAQVQADISANYEVVDEIIDEALELQDTSIEAREMETTNELLTNCAVITHDKPAKTITVFYAGDCAGPNGRVRKGTIQITYTGWKYLPGSVITTELMDFSVNNVKLEGTRTVTNVSENFKDFITLNSTLTGGKVTWPDGTFATRENSYTRTWVRGSRPLNDEYQIEGSGSGVNRDGIAYSRTILAPLVIKRRCRIQGIGLPVMGKVELTRGDNILEVDFGEGACEKVVTLTKEGETKEIAL
ncbi:MAG: hypothetical protein AAF824_02765 [Bacteroidota bacterium]